MPSFLLSLMFRDWPRERRLPTLRCRLLPSLTLPYRFLTSRLSRRKPNRLSLRFRLTLPSLRFRS